MNDKRRYLVSYGMRLTRRRQWYAPDEGGSNNSAGNNTGDTNATPGSSPAGGSNGANPGPTDETSDQNQPPLTWETWLAAQDATVKTLLDEHTAGLKSALDSERSQRKTFEKQLKDLSKQAEDGSELRASLDNLQASVAAANARAEFFELAADPQLGLRDAKLAWAIIQGDPESFTRRGKPDFAALKDAHPILFQPPAPNRTPGHAGSGAGGSSPTMSANERMNNFIRGARG